MKNKSIRARRNRRRAATIALFLSFTFIMLFQFSSAAKSKTAAIVNYEKVVVCSGDTIWSIASDYIEENQDVREMIYDIKKLNDLSSAIIIPGQELLIPCEAR